MEGNIKVKAQIIGMIAIHHGDSTVKTHPLKIHKGLGIGKMQSYTAKTRENPNG